MSPVTVFGATADPDELREIAALAGAGRSPGLAERLAVYGLKTTPAVDRNGNYGPAGMFLVAAPPGGAAFVSEGFCPDCRVPLAGDARNWCPSCTATWHRAPRA